MVHLFKSVRGTKDITFILSAGKSGIIKCYIDVSHEVHPNTRGKTGRVLTMGRGFPILVSRKQNLNTRLVSAQDTPFALILWYVAKIIYLS